ncbi:hypothetical protein L1987_11151 [Smallanthus sonchifolius]|uniref:Uncharacterized protein n=1 Tax=Smallanthus sonchifolius TaxID=185202 RepID=A0ACB9JCA3_9ASTR|nr:hypothetical protein L1987_11151 [Smallanthus sonchifolius]
MKSIHTQHNKAFPETGFRYLSYEGMSSCGVMDLMEDISNDVSMDDSIVVSDDNSSDVTCFTKTIKARLDKGRCMPQFIVAGISWILELGSWESNTTTQELALAPS